MKTASTSPRPLENKRRRNDNNVSLTVEDCKGDTLFHWNASPHRPHLLPLAPSEDPSATPITLLTTMSKEFCVPKHLHFAADIISDCDEPTTEINDDDDVVVTWSIFDLSASEEAKAVTEFVTHCNNHESTIVYGNCHYGTVKKTAQPDHESVSANEKKSARSNKLRSPLDVSPALTSSPTPLSTTPVTTNMPHSIVPQGRALYDFALSYSCNCYSCSCGKGCTTSCCSKCYTYYTYCTAGRYNSPNGYVVDGSSCTACTGGQYQSSTRATSCNTCTAVCFPFCSTAVFLQRHLLF
jgi:hypothetical protein